MVLIHVLKCDKCGVEIDIGVQITVEKVYAEAIEARIHDGVYCETCARDIVDLNQVEPSCPT
jgi:hypothetical protein